MTALPASPTTPGSARRFVRAFLSSANTQRTVIDTVELLASEIVTNALVHVGTESELVIKLNDEAVRVEVTDHDGRFPEMRTPGRHATHGRGLVILTAVADAWGVEPLPDKGKTVWFELHVDA